MQMTSVGYILLWSITATINFNTPSNKWRVYNMQLYFYFHILH